jgi:sirohydrochlorin cobaltochelatase
MTDTTGILLFAHGARDPAWARPFEAVATALRSRAAKPEHVALAFLEFMQPGLVDAGTRLTQAGCQAVTVVPLFLGAGGHVRKDLPLLLDQLRALHPQVHWALAPAVGESELLVRAMADIAWQAASAAPAPPTVQDARP